MSRIQIFDDEIKAKRVFSRIESASKSAYNYVNKNSNKYHFSNGRYASKNMFRKNTEVVVKITSGSKHFQGLSKHIDYISRGGELELITNDFDIYKGQDENIEVKKIFKNEGLPIPQYGKEKKEKRHTINMVFSMKEHSTTPPEKLKQATITTLKRIYPDNFFVVAFHNDTDNPHCHVCLKVANKNGKRINPKKSDLVNMRVEFAKALNELGVEAKATIKNKKNDIEQELKKDIIQNQNQDNKQKMHYYQVMDFGRANYNFSDDENAKKSYYVKYKTKKGITTLWGGDLERVVRENKVLRGEYARFKIVGQSDYQIKRKAKVDGKWQEVIKTLKKPIWDVSVIGREKDLSQKIVVSDNMPKYSIIYDKVLKENEKGSINERDYTEQYRQRVLQELRNQSVVRRESPKERNALRVLSKESMVFDTKRTQMLLHINALSQLQQGERGRSNHIVRRASVRDNGITRDE
ncbi:relaxase/mobilization nuclease domain-containing protein [Campylobacter coli]|nr:relaxase/mobilization nuclease domain-containing protein [Campylobacter coli]ELZ2420757.1 relaxase/mobilization nuclease domain-containing protein [Campylobacter coli]